MRETEDTDGKAAPRYLLNLFASCQASMLVAKTTVIASWLLWSTSTLAHFNPLSNCSHRDLYQNWSLIMFPHFLNPANGFPLLFLQHKDTSPETGLLGPAGWGSYRTPQNHLHLTCSLLRASRVFPKGLKEVPRILSALAVLSHHRTPRELFPLLHTLPSLFTWSTSDCNLSSPSSRNPFLTSSSNDNKMFQPFTTPTTVSISGVTISLPPSRVLAAYRYGTLWLTTVSPALSLVPGIQWALNKHWLIEEMNDTQSKGSWWLASTCPEVKHLIQPFVYA